MVLSFTAGSPNQKASFESNKSNPFKRVVILVNHPDTGHSVASTYRHFDLETLARGVASIPVPAEKPDHQINTDHGHDVVMG